MQTGREHTCLEEYEAAEAWFGKAAEHLRLLSSVLDGPGPAAEQHCKFAEAYFNLLVDRAKNAWRLQQKVCWAVQAPCAKHCSQPAGYCD